MARARVGGGGAGACNGKGGRTQGPGTRATRRGLARVLARARGGGVTRRARARGGGRQSLHDKGVANADHTTLLLQCYAKSKCEEPLEAFLSHYALRLPAQSAIYTLTTAGLHKQVHAHAPLHPCTPPCLHKQVHAHAPLASTSRLRV